jgi:hypothetical protein
LRIIDGSLIRHGLALKTKSWTASWSFKIFASRLEISVQESKAYLHHLGQHLSQKRAKQVLPVLAQKAGLK